MATTQGLMAGKRGLIMGVANNRSIAWGIARALADQGAEIALTYQGDALRKRVEPLAKDLGAIVAGHCDVTDEASIAAMAAELAATPPDLVIVASGVLTLDNGEGPERAFKQIDADAMEAVFRLNTIGPALIAKHFLPLLPRLLDASVGHRVHVLLHLLIGLLQGLPLLLPLLPCRGDLPVLLPSRLALTSARCAALAASSIPLLPHHHIEHRVPLFALVALLVPRLWPRVG
mgnify:CR=1 FL=1